MTSPKASLEESRERVAALVAPRNVVIVGASDRPGSWATRLWHNLKRYGYRGAVYPINPKRTEIWDQPCYPDFASLPEKPDHLAVLVPAPLVPGSLREAASAGARSATIYTAGFDEGHDAGSAKLGEELACAVRETGLGVSGPNCFGNIVSASRLVTFMEDRELPLEPGPAALVGQSGGVMMFTNRVLEERGIYSSYVISSGNETGLTLSDYIAYFATDPAIKVILCYTEAVRDLDKFAAACRMAQEADKPIVMTKLGQSEEGKAAALAHTGALAGSVEAFDAVAGELGVIRTDTLDQAVEAVEFLVHSRIPAGGRLAAITLSGAYRGMLLDAASRNGLSFAKLAPETLERLESLVSVGANAGNPLDGGFAVVSSAETYLACIEAMDADPNTDMLLLQEELPREPGVPRTEKYIGIVEAYVKTRARKPVAFVSMLTHSHSDHSRALRAKCPSVPFLQEANKALYVIKKAVRLGELGDLAKAAPLAVGAARWDAAGLRAIARTSGSPTPVNEVDSKRALAEYGFRTPDERFVETEEAAVAAAEAIGYPVVLKGVAASLTHKSDAGAVVLGLEDGDAVKTAFSRIADNIESANAGPLEGMLVCQQVRGGVELVLGLHRDPEMGLVAMVGGGGVLLELARDVAFGAPPITPAKAKDMLGQTRVSRIIEGYRGGRRFDSAAVVDALVGLGRIAEDFGDILESVDINPFLVMEEGAVMLDALVVLGAAGGGE
jgi:acetyltransferase